MKLVIDASNVVAGGGLVYLVELLRHADPAGHGFGEVDLWGSDRILDKVEARPWLNRRSHRLLNGGYLARFRWSRGPFRRSLSPGDLVFVPSTGYHAVENRVVTMCRNLIPLEMEEINRFFFGKSWLRFMALRFLQLRAYRKSDGVIYLNEYGRRTVRRLLGKRKNGTPGNRAAVIPHGVNREFLHRRDSYEVREDFRLLYVSRINLYKHQWIVAEAAARLREEGLPVRLRLVGDSANQAHRMLEETVRRHPVLEEILEWEGGAAYGELPRIYRSADAYIYGSTCETFGMTLLEAMASSLPIACSERSSMSEMLGDGGIYYDPLSVSSCMEAISRLFESAERRRELGRRARERAEAYDWVRCARETFQFLQTVNR